MAYDEGTLAALRLYADPTLPPAEKQRQLEAMLNPPPALPDARVAGPGGGWGAVDPTLADSQAALEDEAERRAQDSAREERVQARPVEVPGGVMGPAPKPEAETTSAADTSAPVPPEDVTLEEEEPPQSPGVSAGDYRNAASRAALLLTKPAGPAPKPQERITEESQTTVGPLAPEEIDEYRQLQQEAADKTIEADYWRAQQEQGARDVQQRALEAEMSERGRLNQIRGQVMAETARIRARQEQISNEIASAEPVEEGLFVGKNFGQSLLTVVGLLGMGLGMGASGNAEQIAPTIRQMALREVDRQKRWIDLKQGQSDALGTAYERHISNLRDHELASAATVADIMKMAELQTLQLANETHEPRTKAELEAKAAALNAAAVAEYAKLAQAYGNKVQQGVQLTYQQERGAVAKARAAAEAAAQAQPSAAAEGDVEAHLASLENKAPELDADVRAATGQPAPKPAAKGTGAPAAASRSTKPAAAGNGDNIEAVMALHAAGRTDEAVAKMSPAHREYLRKLYAQSKNDLGASATDADALDLAFQKLGAQSPAALIPQTARDRVVTLGDGRVMYGTTKEQAKDAQGKVNRLDVTVANMAKMIRLAARYKNSGTVPPAVKSEIEGLGHALMFDLSLAQEQGTVREAELPLYEKMVGSAIANYVKDPRYDLEAGIREVSRVFNTTRQRVIQNLSPTWTGEGSARRQVREVSE